MVVLALVRGRRRRNLAKGFRKCAQTDRQTAQRNPFSFVEHILSVCFTWLKRLCGRITGNTSSLLPLPCDHCVFANNILMVDAVAGTVPCTTQYASCMPSIGCRDGLGISRESRVGLGSIIMAITIIIIVPVRPQCYSIVEVTNCHSAGNNVELDCTYHNRHLHTNLVVYEAHLNKQLKSLNSYFHVAIPQF